ncbi:charged multivesicular body protein 6 isoform X2 [Alexandromys fortis]|uniref:charged multivesicular body protein 6 isoform X2 n=1 Tax=Alexandromys fortis TaxID=100897 RepID=UPI00215216F3|nr:charged multivesicular body protein 6 isoform X2 [Microtus fortis]
MKPPNKEPVGVAVTKSLSAMLTGKVPLWRAGSPGDTRVPGRRPPVLSRAVAEQLKQQRDKLRQYQKRVTQQLERERALARQLLRDGRKERAKLLLKKKRYREQLLDRTENQISSLEAMVQSIEFTQIEMKVMEGLQVGNECLNKMHQVMSIEEVERILDETQDAVEYQRQIDELLAGNFTQEDEDAILEELNAITQEQIDLPEVPSEPLPDINPAPAKARSRQAELVAAS